MKNSNDAIGNPTRDLAVCSPVPQPTTPPRALSLHLQTETNSVLAIFFTKEWTVSKTKLKILYEFSRPLELGMVVCTSAITVKNVTGNSQS